MARPFAQHQAVEPAGAPAPLMEREPRGTTPFDHPVQVATSRAARHFAGASLGSALLAIASAALFHRSAGSSGSLLVAATDCLLAAVLLQVFARRWMRHELMVEGLHQGLDEQTARSRARAAVARWLRRPRA